MLFARLQPVWLPEHLYSPDVILFRSKSGVWVFCHPRKQLSRSGCGGRGIGPVVWPTGDMDVDMLVIRDFYSGITGKYALQSIASAGFKESPVA